MTPQYDVAIIGFGPTGAIAAGLLGQAGLRTLVVDRSTTVWDKPRAIAIDHEIMRLMQNMGVAGPVLPHVAPFPASEHFGMDGQLIRRVDMVAPPYPLGYTPSMVFTQPPVEAALRAHAEAFATVDVHLGVTFTGLEQDADRATLHLTRPDGALWTVTAETVIGCDGASSAVRQHLGIAYEDLVFDEPWMVIDVRVGDTGLAKLPQTAAQFCEPARPATFIIGPGNHRRWEIMLLPGEDPRAMEAPAEIWQLLSRWIGPEDGTLWRANSYRFHALLAERWRQGRVFIAGDAAHQQPPFIGQGMCQGMRDAANLVWKLVAVHRGEASDTLLDSYETERKQHVRTLTTRIKAIGHAICERDPAAARARDTALLASGGGRAPVVTRQEIVPPLEAGLLGPSHAARGTLFPQPWIQNTGGVQRLDEQVGVGWRLVWDGRCAAEPAAHAMRTVVVGGTGPASIAESEGVLAHWFDRHACVGAIVRPDHYVYAAIQHETDAGPLLAELQTRLSNSRVSP